MYLLIYYNLFMEKQNPNHKEEEPFKAHEGEECQAFNRDLETQDPNEDFLKLKSSLMFFKNQGQVEKIEEQEPMFICLKNEYEASDFLENGLDLVVLADASESIYPWRIYQKKSIYFTLMDIENLFFSAEDITAEHFNKIRLSFISYSDHDKPIDKLDFVEYSKLGEFCDKIDSLPTPKSEEIKKRNVFGAYQALNDLSWSEGSIKIVIHYCPDPQYGVKYTTNPKGMPSDYDPFPEGIPSQNEEEILENISNLLEIGKFNLIKFNNRCEKFSKILQDKFSTDLTTPKIIPLA